MTSLSFASASGQGPTTAGRVRALDGLRGIAAFVVLICHQLVTVPSLDRPSVDAFPVNVSSLSWWLTYTPLHLLWDGAGAVYLFFVLSGYVLALPAIRYRPPNWWTSYYVRRLLRLYVPVIASVVFALVTVAVVHRSFGAGNSSWLNNHATGSHGLGEAAQESVLVRGTGWLNSPLWSLQYEVMFSLLLPVYIVVARRFRALRAVQALALLMMIVGAAVSGSGSLMYLPMFALGVLMAFERERLGLLANYLGRIGWWILLAASLFLLNASWTVFAVGQHFHGAKYADAVGQASAVLGAVLIVFLVGHWAPARAVGEARPVQWLGRRSFSLYLTHEPLVVAVAFALGGHPNPLVLLAICTPAALVLADVFFRLVESPSHRLSQQAGRAVEARLGKRVPTAAFGHQQTEPAPVQCVATHARVPEVDPPRQFRDEGPATELFGR